MRLVNYFLLSLGLHCLFLMNLPSLPSHRTPPVFRGEAVFRKVAQASLEKEKSSSPEASTSSSEASRKELRPPSDVPEETSRSVPEQRSSSKQELLQKPLPKKNEVPRSSQNPPKKPQELRKSTVSDTPVPAGAEANDPSEKGKSQEREALSAKTFEASRNSLDSSRTSLEGDSSLVAWNTTPLRAPEPEYPKIARKLRREGRVLLEIDIAPSGKVERVHILESCRWKELDEAARKGIAQWEFAPPGKAVSLKIPVIFSLKE